MNGSLIYSRITTMTISRLFLFTLAIVLFLSGQTLGQSGANRKLLEYCWAGYLDSIKMLPKIDVNVADADGLTPLHFAAYKGNLPIVQFLVANKARVNTATRTTKVTPLHLAAQQGHRDVVDFLLSKDADIELKTAPGQTALVLAIQEGGRDVVDLLLTLQQQKKIDNVMEEKDADGNSLLHLGAAIRDVDFMRRVLPSMRRIDEENRDGRTALHVACSVGDSVSLEFLLANKANINSQDRYKNSALHYALLDTNVRMASFLVQKGAKVSETNNSRNTPLTLALRTQDVQLVKEILAKGADVDTRETNGSTPLHFAARSGNVELFNLVFQKKPSVLSSNKTILHAAVGSGNIELVKKCIDAKLDVNAKDEDNFTPLHLAVMIDSKDIVQLLIDHGASVQATDGRRRTSLHHAATTGNDPIARLLLSKGAKVDAEDERDLTPLHLTSLGGWTDLASTLVQHGAKLSAESGRKGGFLSDLVTVIGSRLPVARAFVSKSAVSEAIIEGLQEVNLTPLHFACLSKKPDMVKLLIQQKANIDAKTSGGRTPLHVAIDEDDLPTIKAMLEATHDMSAGKTNIEKVFDALFDNANTEGIQLLCEHIRTRSRDIKKLVKDEVPVLHYAAFIGDSTLVKILVENGADINKRHRMTPIQFAILGGHSSVASFFLSRNANLKEASSTGSTALHVAAATRDATLMRLILSKEPDLINEQNDAGQNALMLTAGVGDIEAVKFLLTKGADIKETDSKNRMVLHYAASSKSLPTAEYFATEKALDVNAVDRHKLTPLHMAALSDDIDIVGFLLTKGSKINAQSADGFTALHYAARNGNLELVKLLISKGATHLDGEYEVWEKGIMAYGKAAQKWGVLAPLAFLAAGNKSRNWKPIHLAARRGHTEVVEYLMQNGESASLETNDKLSPIHLASIGGHIPVMKLVTREAPTALLPFDKLTLSQAMSYPARYGNTTKYVITDGCRISAADKNGWTPLHWAYFYEQEEAIRWLKSGGAERGAQSTSEVKITDDVVIKSDVYPWQLEGLLPAVLRAVAVATKIAPSSVHYDLWR